MLKKIFSRENVKGVLKESIETIVFVVVMVIIIRFFIVMQKIIFVSLLDNYKKSLLMNQLFIMKKQLGQKTLLICLHIIQMC